MNVSVGLLIEMVGWAGSLLLSFSSIPQIIKLYRSKTTGNVSALMLAQWFLGLLCVISFAIHSKVPWPILGGYFINLTLVSVLVTLYMRYRK